MREARTAGTNAPVAATANATIITKTIVEGLSEAFAPPMRPAPGSLSVGGSHPTDRQADRRREQGDHEIFGEQHGRDQAWCAADRLESSHAPDLIGHPTSDEHGDAREREQCKQPTAGQQDPPLVSHEVAVRVADLLPRLKVRWLALGVGPAVQAALVGEGVRLRGVCQLQIQNVGKRLRSWREASSIWLSEPDQAGADGSSRQVRGTRSGPDTAGWQR